MVIVYFIWWLSLSKQTPTLSLTPSTVGKGEETEKNKNGKAKVDALG